jgi:hypothetical protein
MCREEGLIRGDVLTPEQKVRQYAGARLGETFDGFACFCEQQNNQLRMRSPLDSGVTCEEARLQACEIMSG